MFEDKIHTQRDKTFSGAFDPTVLEAVGIPPFRGGIVYEET